MTPEFLVRPATLDDAASIAAIYNQGIRGRMATFETAERSAEDIASWLAAPYPFLVGQHGEGETSQVVGWIHATSYRPRLCYAGVAEFSVYVAEGFRGHGVGDRLMAGFLPACAAAGFWKVLSRIFVENAASRALCARHGFREVGVYEKHGRLDGVWRDVVIVERIFAANVV
jgi:L-amino acid N-acyltransferase YncA